MQVLDDIRAGFVDVKVLKLAPELVQIDATARGNFARKLGFWYRPLNSDDIGIVPFLRHVDVGEAFLKTHGAGAADLLLCYMSNVPRLTASVSRELLGPCYCKPQAGRVYPAHAQWVLAGKSYSWRDHALSLSTTSEQTTSIRGGYFTENYKWGHPRHFRNFYATHKKSITVREKTRPPLTLLITCYQIKEQRLLQKCCLRIESNFLASKRKRVMAWVTSRVRVEVFSLISCHAIFSLTLLSFTDN